MEGFSNAIGEIVCKGDTEEPPAKEENEGINCFDYPINDDDDLEECIKLTPAKGRYCCLLSFENNGDKGTSCLSISKEEYEDRNIALNKLKKMEGYENAKGEIICDGDKNKSTAFKIEKRLLGLLLFFI